MTFSHMGILRGLLRVLEQPIGQNYFLAIEGTILKCSSRGQLNSQPLTLPDNQHYVQVHPSNGQPVQAQQDS